MYEAESYLTAFAANVIIITAKTFAIYLATHSKTGIGQENRSMIQQSFRISGYTIDLKVLE
jgi:hypothetical protein